MRLLNTKLRKDAIELRALAAAGGDTAARKDEMLAELFQGPVHLLWPPVDRFDFAYTDKDGVYHVDRGMTPVSFYEKYIGLALEDYVSVIHAPTAGQTLRQDLHRQVSGQRGGRPGAPPQPAHEGAESSGGGPAEGGRAGVVRQRLRQVRQPRPTASGTPTALCTASCWAGWTWA